jgi:hypothetical protein
MSIFQRLFDERFLAHRQRSTSLMGLVGVALAGGLFLYRLYFQHLVSWDLFAIVATMATVKLGAMAWFHATK